MRIFHGLDELPEFVAPAVSVGSFDGVHYGHREIISALRSAAERTAGETVVVTFSPNPRFLTGDRSGVKLLNTLPEKAMLLEAARVQNLIILPFTEELMKMPYDRFVSEIIKGKIGAAAMVVGYNHHFGRDKQGNYGSLEEMSDREGLQVMRVEKKQTDIGKVSSTILRNLIAEGKFLQATVGAGYQYFIHIPADSGPHLRFDEPKLLPPPGHYQVEVWDRLRFMNYLEIRFSSEGQEGSVVDAVPLSRDAITVDRDGTIQLPANLPPGDKILTFAVR